MFRNLVGKEEKPVLLERPAILTSAFIWAIMAVVVSGVTWAAVAQIDQSVPATGKLEPEEGAKEVKAPSGGVVREILVENGEEVEEGQLLVTFDPTGQEADSDSLKRNRTALQRQLDVLRSEAVGTDVGSASNGGAVADLKRNRQIRVAENLYYRALLRGESVPPPSQRSRLVENRAARNLFRHLLRPLYGSALQQKRSFLLEPRQQWHLFRHGDWQWRTTSSGSQRHSRCESCCSSFF